MASAAAAQRLLASSTKIIGVGRNYIAHAKELNNPVPKVRSARLPSSIPKRCRASNFRPRSFPRALHLESGLTLRVSLPAHSRAAARVWIDFACV